MEKKEFHIVAKTEIHTRPATLLVQTTNKFSPDINSEYKGESVNPEPIMGVTSLGIDRSSDVVITANGTDEAERMVAIAETLQKEGLAE